MKIRKYLDMAAGVALESKCRFKHGCVVVRHGKVLGSSPNVEKNNPRFVDYEHASVHAEIRAMQRAGWPTGVTVFVARVNNLGEQRLSKPCANCETVLKQYRCKVFWTE